MRLAFVQIRSSLIFHNTNLILPEHLRNIRRRILFSKVDMRRGDNQSFIKFNY